MNLFTAMPSPETSRPSAVAPSPLLGNESSRQTLLDGLPGMAFLGHTDRHRTLEWVSDGGGTLLGLESSAPFELARLIHPEEREMVMDYVATAAANLQPFALEYRVRHSSGNWRTVWEQSRPVRHGHEILLHGYILDVTARSERDRARWTAAQERLQLERTLALNRLARGIVHELGNFVQGIQGSAETAESDLPPGHSEVQDSLKNILEASRRTSVFVQKIREFAQRPVPERKLIALEPVLEDCLQILRAVIPDKVEIVTHFAPGCPPVWADAACLHQAVVDLCLYARQGLSEGRGRLEISLTHQRQGRTTPDSQLRAGSRLCLSVRDNGPGLDKSSVEKIFDPFCSRKTTGKQMGLEMFLVRETVQAHQGEIIVESEPDQGTAFHIYLPVSAES